jgi:hypothetical protein
MAFETENLIAASLSGLLSLTMIAIYVAFPALRSFARKLLTILAFLDFVSVVGRFLPFFAGEQSWRNLDDDSGVCIAQTAMIIFSDCSSFIVTGSIAIYAYQQVMLDSALAKIENFSSKLQFYLSVSMIYPICWTAFILSNSSHSSKKDDFGCWVTEKQPFVRFGSTYVPCWISWVICIYAYCRIFLRLRAVSAFPGLKSSEHAVSLLSTKQHSDVWQKQQFETYEEGEEWEEEEAGASQEEGDDNEEEDADHDDGQSWALADRNVGNTRRSRSRGSSKIVPAKLIFVPLIFVFLHIWGSINVIQDLSGSKKKRLVLLLESLCDPAQGFWNGLIYALLSPQVHVQVKAALGKCK